MVPPGGRRRSLTQTSPCRALRARQGEVCVARRAVDYRRIWGHPLTPHAIAKAPQPVGPCLMRASSLPDVVITAVSFAACSCGPSGGAGLGGASTVAASSVSSSGGLDDGEVCVYPNDCKSHVCLPAACCVGDCEGHCGVPSPSCCPSGTSCTQQTTCCGQCTAMGASIGICCSATGASCSTPSDCCSGICQMNICM